MLLSSQSAPVFDLHREEVEQLLQPWSCRFVAAPGCYSPRKLRTLYVLALRAGRLGRRIPVKAAPWQRAYTIDDFRTMLIIDLCASTFCSIIEKEDFLFLMERDVYLIACYDHQSGTDLLEVMFAYLATNHSLSRTAELLHMHKNTVHYKLNKIKKITGKDLPFGKQQFDYLFSYYVQQYAAFVMNHPCKGTQLQSLEWIKDLQEAF